MYIQECKNHRGSNSCMEAKENSLDVLNDPQSSWKYTVKSTLFKAILSSYMPLKHLKV